MRKEKRIDCPALRMRSNSYPFGNRVPRTVRMLRTVTADPMPVTGFSYIKGYIPVAPVDEIFKVWTNSHGTVAAVLPNGTHLGLHPEEFEVETWHDLSTEATVGLVDFGFDDRTTKVTQEAYSIFLAREAASREKIDALQLRLNEADQRIDELTAQHRGKQVASMPVERSHDVRDKQILTFNTCRQDGGDLNDALGAAYQAAPWYTPYPALAEPKTFPGYPPVAEDRKLNPG